MKLHVGNLLTLPQCLASFFTRHLFTSALALERAAYSPAFSIWTEFDEWDDAQCHLIELRSNWECVRSPIQTDKYCFRPCNLLCFLLCRWDKKRVTEGNDAVVYGHGEYEVRLLWLNATMTIRKIKVYFESFVNSIGFYLNFTLL